METIRYTTHQTADNNTMHAKPDLRVFIEAMISGSGSVIVAVIRSLLF